jgi:acetyl esterase/lipase
MGKLHDKGLKNKTSSFFGVVLFMCIQVFAGQAQEVENLKLEPLNRHCLPVRISYKTIDAICLSLEFFYPPQMDENQKYPAIVFFYGGGWAGGSTDQFKPHAQYFAKRGMIAVLADYRVRSRHGTTPFEAVSDAKSAIRFIRENAAMFQIDPDKIVASGGSAGGHLAAATGTLKQYDEKSENPAISSVPNAMVLFNPVFDNGPGGFAYKQIGEKYRDFSPLHNISSQTPPAIILLGTEDHLIPVATARKFQEEMHGKGNRCDLFLFNGQKHGFFNYQYPEYYNKTIQKADSFVVSIGFLKP